MAAEAAMRRFFSTLPRLLLRNSAACNCPATHFRLPLKARGSGEMADTQVLEACALRREGSSPSFRTIELTT
jgi:hypothetical protein